MTASMSHQPQTHGYLKLTRAGLQSVWFQRATVRLNFWKQHQVWGTAKANRAINEPLASPDVRKLWEDVNWNPEGMVWITKRQADKFFAWARSLDGWRDFFVVWGDRTGESRL